MLSVCTIKKNNLIMRVYFVTLDVTLLHETIYRLFELIVLYMLLSMTV